jgi:hypothetical protein
MLRPLSALKPKADAVRSHALTRLVLLAFWCFVLWGTLLDLVALWMLLTQGPSLALQNLQALSATNALTAALAILVWLTVAWMTAVGVDAN